MDKLVYDVMNQQLMECTTRMKKEKWKPDTPSSKYHNQSVVPAYYKDEFVALE